MKEITLFMLPNCPHCKLAFKLQDELRAERPEFSELNIKMIDESIEKELAGTFDYYYVPCYYIDGEKVHEGHAEKEDVEAVFAKALEE